MPRANFEVTADQQEVLAMARAATHASSIKDGVLRACQVTVSLAREAAQGNQIFVGKSRDAAARFVVPEFESTGQPAWQWLVPREHPWKTQLWVKGRKLLASSVWSDMKANDMDRGTAMDNWELPGEAIDEIQAYCEASRALIQAEAAEERLRLTKLGVRLEVTG